MRRFWIVSVIVLAVAGALGFWAWRPAGDGANDAPYRTATADRGPITATVRATGTLNPVTTVLVGSQLSGQVVEILADYNTPVKAGQVVARIYAEQIKSRRDAARADLSQARADLAMRRAQVERSRASRLKADATLRDVAAQKDRVAAQLAEARRNLDRQTELNARNVGSQTALESARTQAEIQRAALASSEAQIAALQAEASGLQADIALAEAQVAAADAAILQREAKLRDIEIDLGRTEIRSPVDGVVIKRDIDLGQTVAASLSAPTLFTVAQDLKVVDIHANIDEADVGRLKPGQPVSFTVNAYPNRTFDGTVRSVRLGAQTLQNVVTYTAVIAVENSDMALLPGMTANLAVTTDERPNALRVSNAALRFRPPGGGAPAPIPAAPLAAVAAAPSRGSRPLEGMRERLMTEVQPTSEQVAAIDKIMAEARAHFPGRDGGLTDEDRRTAMRQFRREVQDKIAAVLDPERRAQFEAITGEGRRGPPPAADPGAPGRVHVLDAAGRPVPVALRLGISDGSYTEVLAGDLKEGAAVVTGGGPRPQAAPEASPAQRPRGPRPF